MEITKKTVRDIDLNNQKGMEGYLITNCDNKLPLPPNIKNIYWKNI